MIKAILFDFYGVFVPDAYNEWLKQNNLERTGTYRQLIEDLDRAAIDNEAFLDGLSTALGRPVRDKEIHRAVLPDDRLITVVKRLAPTYKIGLLSNASRQLRAKLITFGIVDLFDEIIISSEIGWSKPAPESFEIAIGRIGYEAHEVLFIDDNPQNVSAANKCGLTSILFTSSAQLEKDLSSHLSQP